MESNEFKDLLKNFRKREGMTQETLAKESKVSLGSIRQYERGERKPKLETIKKIAEVLGVSEDDLVSGGTKAILEKEEFVDKLMKSLFVDRGTGYRLEHKLNDLFKSIGEIQDKSAKQQVINSFENILLSLTCISKNLQSGNAKNLKDEKNNLLDDVDNFISKIKDYSADKNSGNVDFLIELAKELELK